MGTRRTNWVCRVCGSAATGEVLRKTSTFGTGYCSTCATQRMFAVGTAKAPPSTPDPNSQEAAASMRPSAGHYRTKVLNCIRDMGPIAEWQIELALDLRGNTVRPRVWELMEAGLIRRLDRDGKTPSGRRCWRLVVA